MSFLDKILIAKRAEIAVAQSARPLDAVKSLAARRTDFRPFAAALNAPGIRVIAEIKRASPSLGDIAPHLDPAALARAYTAGGAAALSVLTEPAYFKGSAADLQQARAATTIPVLRKDFIIDPYQVYETAAIGADAMLLIVRILDVARLRDLLQLAHSIGLDTLVEIHDEADARRLDGINAPVIGINNRDLAHFHTDVHRAARIADLLPPDTAVVAASGIRNATDIRQSLASGIRRFLVGEALVKTPDPAALLREWTSHPMSP
ncbi:MAG: indole-3-glycerol phosphate synthase TrpC [Lentisphaerae bacterium]|jgi:indole-3-glycerol phosphate synthase|nr:indole-3-glycerol phosphate synthase TrpC [Lentisphaerota bacterium]